MMTALEKIQGAIFDMDGTLLDSMPIWDRVGDDYLLAKGIAPPENLYEILREKSMRQCAAYFQSLGVSNTEKEILEGINLLVREQYRSKVPLKEDAAAFLETLKQHKVKMCVATATSPLEAGLALKRLGIWDYFSFVITCNELGAGKDSPQIYEYCLERLGTPKETTVVFEDAFHAVRTAKSAGFPVAGIYDKSAAAFQREIAETADWSFYTYQEWENMEWK